MGRLIKFYFIHIYQGSLSDMAFERIRTFNNTQSLMNIANITAMIVDWKNKHQEWLSGPFQKWINLQTEISFQMTILIKLNSVHAKLVVRALLGSDNRNSVLEFDLILLGISPWFLLLNECWEYFEGRSGFSF